MRDIEVDYRIAWPLDLAARFRIRGLTALVGASGVGKTTLLRALCGLVPAHGKPFVGLTPEQRRIGFLPQNYGLFPHLNALDNVAYPLRGQDRRRQAGALLQRVRMGAFGERFPHALSGGQCQRVALARALARQPDLLLLDEPASALEPALRDALFEELAGVIHDIGLPALVATHDPQLAQQCDWMAVLDRGVVVQEDTPATVFSRPLTRSLARLLGFRNLFDGRLELAGADAALDTAAGRLVVDAASVSCREGAVHWGIRSEDIQVLPESYPSHRLPRDNVLIVKVRRLRRQGLTARVTVGGPVDLELLLPRHVQDGLGLAAGQSVRVYLPPAYLRVFPPELEAFASDD